MNRQQRDERIFELTDKYYRSTITHEETGELASLYYSRGSLGARGPMVILTMVLVGLVLLGVWLW